MAKMDKWVLPSSGCLDNSAASLHNGAQVRKHQQAVSLLASLLLVPAVCSGRDKDDPLLPTATFPVSGLPRLPIIGPGSIGPEKGILPLVFLHGA